MIDKKKLKLFIKKITEKFNNNSFSKFNKIQSINLIKLLINVLCNYIKNISY